MLIDLQSQEKKEDEKNMKEIKKYLAEFIGTAVLVFFACGVAGQICATGVSGLIVGQN